MDAMNPLRSGSRPGLLQRQRIPRLLLGIGLFKLVKSALLLLAALVTLQLITHDVAKFIIYWANMFRFDPNTEHIHNLINYLLNVDKNKLRLLCVGTFVYAVLYGIEGIGLLLDRTWAEWLTVITTAGFIPLELYEVHRHGTAKRVALLCCNVVILAYLIYYVRRKIRRHREEKHVRQQEQHAMEQPGKGG